MVILGVCPLSQRVLTEQVTQAVRRYDLGAVARLPGSFRTFVRAPYGTYAAGDVAGLHRLHLSATGEAASRPGHATAPLAEATGVHLYDDGSVRQETYWTPPMPRVPATVTGPLLARRLRMAVEARAFLVTATAVATEAAIHALMRNQAADLSGPGGRITLDPAGFNALFRPSTPRPARPRLDQARSAARRHAAGTGAATCLRLPMVDAHVLEALLATRERDIRSGRLFDQVRQMLGL
ncbi:hypothetical protein [Verrucosispora sioxanthis]|uniref:Uncharacterized protein n=1 Tax=Verrucosispora sioxanthis TaxID=2499994 RepID=A0A6M1L3T4_9ACTN|nr:hypothetical protein [Verrucosispora sioxanthis]NEE64447.1 hypothetical protein [Verrucosispora sioxanthis]NGM13557.1 hypothetical protein [Verrucosispora sioxanthis]